MRDVQLNTISEPQLRELKRNGFSDRRLAYLLNSNESKIREYRHSLGIRPVYKRVDSCAAEFAATTAYLYSCYEEECEADVDDTPKIMVLGSGPNRIGQGIEFDYCCVHAALAVRNFGYQSIMVNCNPETVSTDFDTSDRLYFEPLTLEDVLEIIHVEKPQGVIIQYGGQTPLKMARDLEAAGAPIIGTSPESIDLAEDRERFQQLIESLDLRQPPNSTVRDTESAMREAHHIGYPLVVRPSYVLGGRAMEIVHNDVELQRYMQDAVTVSEDSPVLLDRFLDDAIEVDVDAVFDGENLLIGGIMEHIEQAGVHSGDSACSLPPISLTSDVLDQLRVQTHALARGLNVLGLMNIQFAIQNQEVFILEVNPRASRTVPFVSKAMGLPLGAIATGTMLGHSLEDQGFVGADTIPNYFAVKEAVFPFMKFPGVDPILGPEMKSTGEVMGVGKSFPEAFARALLAVDGQFPITGKAFISVRDRDKDDCIILAQKLAKRGFSLVGTRGTAQALIDAGIECAIINKVAQGRPHIVDLLKNNEIDIIVNTTEGRQAISDSQTIRRTAVQQKVPYATTVAWARAMIMAMDCIEITQVTRLQDWHQETRR